VFFDWLAKEGWIIVNWWLLVTIAGLTVLPLMTRLLGGLPDRGYTLARPAGILLVSFVFWLLASLGFLNNTPGSVLIAWLIVLAGSITVWFSYQERFNLRDYWQENRTVIIATEILFVLLLVSWATVRAYQNNFSGTEKMMDLAFMSAVQRSETFPPNDPWLSGYAISYYYFGYVMGAILSMMSGIWATSGYNMHIAMLFALTGTAAFGITYNLVRSRARYSGSHLDQQPLHRTAILTGLLAMVFMILLGNFHTLIIQIPYQNISVSESYLRFWDAKNLDTYGGRTEPINLLSAESADRANWWWFDASRTITERDLNNQRVNEVINEFPQFSFLLADSHPHVMTLPYVLLAMGLALNTLLIGRRPDITQTLFYGLCVGSLIFLNTWDAPIYLTLLVAADALRRLIKNGKLTLLDWLEMSAFGVVLLAITVLAYLPFLVGFRSQLGGVLPNTLHPTRFQQLFVMFGPFFLILIFFLAVEAWRGRNEGRINWRFGLLSAGGVLLVLVGSFASLLIGGRLSPQIYNTTTQFIEQNGGWTQVIGELALRRLERILTPVFLLAGVLIIVARLFPGLKPKQKNVEDGENATTYSPATGFTLVLIGVGLMLILIPEFVYLRDNFGTRMNTVFKFYYQAWVVFSIASAYGVYTFLGDKELRLPAMPLRVLFVAILLFVLGGGMLYPIIGIYSRTQLEGGSAGRSGTTPTLDGGSSVVRGGLDDYEALMCLRTVTATHNDVTVAEAAWNGSYDFGGSGRTGALTGLPSVLGWRYHEAQWRGTAFESSVGTRLEDIERLYRDMTLDSVLSILTQYSIDYILYGVVEREYYGTAGEDKFRQSYEIVCEAGNTRIYRVPQPTIFTRQ